MGESLLGVAHGLYRNQQGYGHGQILAPRA
jgi:hypothetical protein